MKCPHKALVPVRAQAVYQLQATDFAWARVSLRDPRSQRTLHGPADLLTLWPSLVYPLGTMPRVGARPAARELEIRGLCCCGFLVHIRKSYVILRHHISPCGDELCHGVLYRPLADD